MIISAFGNFLIVETKVLPLTIPTLTLNAIMMENTDLIVAEKIAHLYWKQENQHLEKKVFTSYHYPSTSLGLYFSA